MNRRTLKTSCAAVELNYIHIRESLWQRNDYAFQTMFQVGHWKILNRFDYTVPNPNRKARNDGVLKDGPAKRLLGAVEVLQFIPEFDGSSVESH